MQKGQQIRDYVLDQKIGEGGMGEVWSATHQVLHRTVAIKAMAAHLAADPQYHNCWDLDLAIYDGETPISQDLAKDDHPALVLDAPRSGEYQLKVSMPGCSEAACWYGIGLFVKDVPPPAQ